MEKKKKTEELHPIEYGTRPLFIFHQKEKEKNTIIIYANSYLEAKALLCSINDYAEYIYDLNEYKRQEVRAKSLWDVCGISFDYCEIPTFVSKDKYEKLKKDILDIYGEQRVLTNNLLEEISPNSKSLFTTEEFIDCLKTNMVDNIHIKEEIEDYLINKYPILKTHIITRGSNFDLYTNSTEQTEVIMDKMREYDNNIHADYKIYNENFITGTDIKSINNYKELNKQLQENKDNCSFKDIKTPFFMFGNSYQEYNSYMLPKKEN